MFSIIVCSISPHKAEALKRNIGNTASMPFEMLIFDNRQVGMGICAVYNKMAEQAKYNNLLFVHEDIVFHTSGWDRVLADKFAEADCGVIGFAGGTSKYPFPYGWGSSKRFIHRNYIQDFSISESKHIKESADEPFTEVITLDGMFLAARKDVWSKCRFDDKTFSGFHSYDTDFSTSVYVAGFKNYVCNDVMYYLLYSIEKKWPDLVGGFIHVPYAASQVVNMPATTPSMSLQMISDGLRIAAETVIASKDDIAVVGGETH